MTFGRKTNDVPFRRLLLTGAAGGIGTVMRPRLGACAELVRVSDLPGALSQTAAAHEEWRPCDLADKRAVDELVAGCDAIVHLGGVSIERPFEEILEANIKGVFHIYEGARRHGVRRVVFRQFEPCHRFLSPGRNHRHRGLAQTRWLLRLVQIIRRGSGAVLFRSLRH